VYVKDDDAANLAICDLDQAEIRDYGNELGKGDNYIVRVRMATWSDIRHGLEAKCEQHLESSSVKAQSKQRITMTV
jgi:hypothetical protein